MTIRHLPPFLFGAGNLAYGLAGLLDSHRTLAYTHVPGPLVVWAAAFIALGAAILAADMTRRLPAVAVAAVTLWVLWAMFSVEAHVSHPGIVTLKGPTLLGWVAFLHFLLAPPRRT